MVQDRNDIGFRRPTVDDGAAVYELVCETGALEPNTSYAYLLLCSDFADSSLVATAGDRIVGFVGAYKPPKRPEAIFVWQVGVHPEMHGQGLGGRLLDELVTRDPSIRYLEATVTPSNGPSNGLFRSFARRRGAACEVSPRFESKHFPGGNHEPEHGYRIGPLGAQA